MIGKVLAAALLSTFLVSVQASAQNAPQTAPQTSDAVSTNARIEGQWRSSKVIGVNVYNDAGDKIGAIDDLIIDKSGKIDNVVLSVGGFLGIGERHVAVPMDKLTWVNEPIRSSAAKTAPGSGSTAPSSTTGAAGTGMMPARNASNQWYPDHAVYNVTKDQLKAMPEFKY